MLIKTRGIVFKTRKYSETSVIAEIYTEEKGLRSYIISGVRSSKSKVSAGLLQVMTIVDLVAYFREDQDLSRIKEIKPHFVYSTLPFDVKKAAVGLFMIDIARKTIQGHEASPELFEFLVSYFNYLDGANYFTNTHLHFLVNLSSYLGFQMGGEFTQESCFFNMQIGTFVIDAPQHPNWLKPELSKILSQLLITPLERCFEIQMSKTERKLLLSGLLDYNRLHIEHFPEVHSHVILEEVLS
jgi:DNA repair protein RecO (recombination protein O)